MQGQKDQLLSQVFSSVDCVLLCFNLADESSLQHCQKWAELVKKHALHPDALFILVGLQQDRRFGEEQASCVLRESGEVQAVEMGAVAYLECSSKQDTGVKTVFQQAFRTAQKAKASRVKDRDHRICSTREICNLPCVPAFFSGVLFWFVLFFLYNLPDVCDLGMDRRGARVKLEAMQQLCHGFLRHQSTPKGPTPPYGCAYLQPTPPWALSINLSHL
eukprot:g2228.t1